MLTESFISYQIAKMAASSKNIKEKFITDDEYFGMTMSIFVPVMIISWILFLFVTVMPKVLLARACNPNNKFAYGLLAFFFGEIYLLQWSIRKFLMNEPGYCKV